MHKPDTRDILPARRMRVRRIGLAAALVATVLIPLVSLLPTPRAGGDTVDGSIATGANPVAVAVNPVTNKIYVAGFDSANVTVIDGATQSTSTVATGSNPNA